MQPLSGNQRPDLLTSLMNMSLVSPLLREMHLCRSSSNVPRLPSFLDMQQNLHVLLTLARCRTPGACHAKRNLNVQKCSVPLSFCTFDFGMCFAPQRRALFRHLTFQKWPQACVFCAFCLRNVLPATTACTFSTSKSGPNLCVLCILTWKILEMCFALQRRAMFHLPSGQLAPHPPL